MAILADVFTESERTNWLKAWLAIDIAKSGIEQFAENVAKTLHGNIYNVIWSSVPAPVACIGCHTANLLKCPSPGVCNKRGAHGKCKSMHDTALKQPRPCPFSVCDKVLVEIAKQHKFSNPSWKNTLANHWASSPWQIAKAYLPPDGYIGKSSVQDTDFNGIISFIMNCKHFDNMFSFAIAPGKTHPPCPLTKARDIGRYVRHSSTCEVTDTDLQDIFNTLTSLLTDPKCLAHDVAAQEAVRKLAKLQTDVLKLTTEEIVDLLEAAHDKLKKVENIHVTTIEKMRIYIENCRKDLSADTDKCQHELSEHTGKCQEELSEHTGKCKQEFDEHCRKSTESNYEQSCNDILKTHPNFDFKLRAVCQQCGRKSEDLKSLCYDVCKSISAFKCVRHVYAAFKESDDTGVTFVVTVGSGVELVEIEACLDDLEIVYVIKCVEFKKDGNEDKHNQQNVAIQDKDITLLRNCIKNHAGHLYSKHRYLSIIKGCVHQVNNSNSGNDDQYEVLLALYVHAKGYIPIEEEPFTKTIGGIQIHVREGLFIPLMYADEVLEPISMGCQVSRHQSGTLGVFFEHARYGLCGITSAHVLLTDEELQQCKKQRGKLVTSKINEVFQPRSPDTIGKIMEVIYREGDDLNRGLEIGLIAIETRKPKQGKFPSPRSGEDLELKYSSGRADELRQNNLNCVKFGAATGYTKGTIVNKSLPNVMRSTPWTLISGSAEIVLYNQVEIQPESGSFADFGDSGAPVFVMDGDGELVCVGIVSGGINQSQNVMITPMTVILEEFGISKLKTFTPNLELMEQRIEQLVQGLLPARNVAQ